MLFSYLWNALPRGGNRIIKPCITIMHGQGWSSRSMHRRGILLTSILADVVIWIEYHLGLWINRDTTNFKQPCKIIFDGKMRTLKWKADLFIILFVFQPFIDWNGIMSSFIPYLNDHQRIKKIASAATPPPPKTTTYNKNVLRSFVLLSSTHPNPHPTH